MENLPLELIDSIFNNLCFFDQINFSKTCILFNEYSKYNTILIKNWNLLTSNNNKNLLTFLVNNNIEETHIRTILSYFNNKHGNRNENFKQSTNSIRLLIYYFVLYKNKTLEELNQQFEKYINKDIIYDCFIISQSYKGNFGLLFQLIDLSSTEDLVVIFYGIMLSNNLENLHWFFNFCTEEELTVFIYYAYALALRLNSKEIIDYCEIITKDFLIDSKKMNSILKKMCGCCIYFDPISENDEKRIKKYSKRWN